MSAHVPLHIQHATGMRLAESYTLPGFTRARAVRVSVARGSASHAITGDRLELPSELPIALDVTAASLSAAYALAYIIVAEAETADALRFHWGDVSVDGVLGAAIEPIAHDSVRLTLRFHLANPRVCASPPLSTITWDALTPTWDDDSVTWDASLRLGGCP